MSDFHSISALCTAAQACGVPISEIVLEDQARQLECTPQELYQRMLENLNVMRQAVQAGMAPDLRSTSGLTGGDAAKMQQYSKTGSLIGSFLTASMTRAIAVAEYNAAMGRIVAAPTAGSCGILPGTVVSMLEEGKCTEKAGSPQLRYSQKRPAI
jgi:L-serine dehydratase